MHNRKIIASGLAIGITISSLSTESMANTIGEHEMIKEEKIYDSSKDNMFERIIKNLFIKKSEPKETIKFNKNIVRNSVFEITLSDGQNIQDLAGNPDGYETVVVKTTGDKLLDSADFSALNLSTIPNIDLSGAKATTMPVGAFFNNASLVSFKFPQGLTTIGTTGAQRGPLQGCSNLVEISDIPDTVVTIGNSAFKGCSSLKTELKLPSSLKTLYNEAFNGCSKITGNLELPEGLTLIGSQAFYNCSSLTGDLIIPEGITSVGGNAFYGCRGLNGNLVIPESVTSIGGSAFYNCSNLTGELIIPESVTSIGASAFYGCSGFTGDLIIPDSVKGIHTNVFRNCSGLTGRLVLPEGITSIGSNAFDGCSGLTGNLVMPNGVTNIDANAFNGCVRLTGRLIIPDSVTTIGTGAFSRCSGFSGNFVLPNGITSIGANAFNGCSGLTGKIMIPEGLTVIEGGIFQGCRGLTGELKIPEGVTSIGQGAFYGCIGLTGSLKIPELVTSIGTNAFRNCSGFTGDLIIPDSVTTIGSNTFEGCTGLNGRLVISNSVTSIGNAAFAGCPNLSGDVYIPNSLTSVAGNIFNTSNKIGKVVIKIDENDESTEYKKAIIERLPLAKVKIEAPVDIDFTGTWIETSNIEVIKPTIKSMIDGVEGEVVEKNNEKIILNIPMLFIESESSILKDGEVYKLPKVNQDGKYVLTDEGDYELSIKTKLGTIYNLEFKVRTKEMQEAESLVNEIIDTTPTVENLEDVRRMVNELPESFRKEELQRALNTISVDLELERENATANLDIYIKSESMLSLSLDTNSVTFDNYNGTEDIVKPNAINLTVSSSLPYKVDASLESEIQNSNKTNTMDISLFNIKDSNDSAFKEFTGIKAPLTLFDNQSKGNGNNHSIDLKLKGSLAHKADIYKTTIKFQIEQK